MPLRESGWGRGPGRLRDADPEKVASGSRSEKKPTGLRIETCPPISTNPPARLAFQILRTGDPFAGEMSLYEVKLI
jgi:hypothetical protein